MSVIKWHEENVSKRRFCLWWDFVKFTHRLTLLVLILFILNLVEDDIWLWTYDCSQFRVISDDYNSKECCLTSEQKITWNSVKILL